MTAQGHLFSAGNVGHLYLAQALAYKIKKNGGKCYLLHNTNKNKEQTHYFSEAFKKLIAPDLWEEVWYLNDGGTFSYSYVWPKIVDPFKSKKILLQTQNKLEQLFTDIPNLHHLYFFHLNSPKTQYLASLALDKGVKLHCVENGYATNMSSPYKAELIDYDKNIISKIRKLLSKLFLQIIGINPWVLLRHPFVIHPEMHLNFIHALFPEKFSHQKAEIDLKPLSETISDEAVEYLLMDLKAKGFQFPETAPNSCVFLSRPDDADTFLSSQDFDEITELIIQKLLSRYDKVYIKPHPREAPGRYNAIISRFEGAAMLDIDYQVPIELAAKMTNIIDWYGTWSYALLTIKLLCGLNSYALLPIYLDILTKKGKDTRKYQKVLIENKNMYPTEIDWVKSINNI